MRDSRQGQKEDRRQAEDVLVAVEQPVVAQEDDEECERGEPDDDPEPLAQGEVGVDPVDHRQPDCGQEAAEREEERVSVREREAEDHVRRHEDGEEEGRVRERSGRDDVLTGDVDGREAGCGQQADEEEVDELAIPERQS